MRGQYNSYSGVFIEGTQNADVEHMLPESYEWEYDSWGNICDLIFSDDKSNGIAAVLESEYVSGFVPTERSEDDSEQGWGPYNEPTKPVNNFHELYIEKEPSDA